jgi:hypothetical protein
MERCILGFSLDDEGDWVALLDCGHRRHVRHRPPFQDRAWVVNAEGRASRLGTRIDCRLCDREEPAGGEPPCLADRVCPQCGALVDGGGGSHRPGCEKPQGTGGEVPRGRG